MVKFFTRPAVVVVVLSLSLVACGGAGAPAAATVTATPSNPMPLTSPYPIAVFAGSLFAGVGTEWVNAAGRTAAHMDAANGVCGRVAYRVSPDLPASGAGGHGTGWIKAG